MSWCPPCPGRAGQVARHLARLAVASFGSRAAGCNIGGAGDLLAKVQVQVPQRLTDDMRDAVEVLAKHDSGHDPRTNCSAGHRRSSR